MFEEYLSDSNYFATTARETDKGANVARCYYRASIMCAWSAMEAFVNYVALMFQEGEALQPYELALLNDRRFGLQRGEFAILEKTEYHPLADKLRLLMTRFVPDFDFEHSPSWSWMLQFKEVRDQLVHPRQEEDETELEDYDREISRGLSAIIDVMNVLCEGIFKRPLRKKLIDLKL